MQGNNPLTCSVRRLSVPCRYVGTFYAPPRDISYTRLDIACRNRAQTRDSQQQSSHSSGIVISACETYLTPVLTARLRPRKSRGRDGREGWPQITFQEMFPTCQTRSESIASQHVALTFKGRRLRSSRMIDSPYAGT